MAANLNFLRGAKLEYVLDLREKNLKIILEDDGGQSASLSAGGQSESRTYGLTPHEIVEACNRRLHQIDPVTYPARVTRTRPNFAGA